MLALDPGLSTGFAVVRVDVATGTGAIVECGFIEVDTASPYVGDWCIDFQRRISELAARVRPTEVAVEDYFFSGRKCQGAAVNTAYRAAAQMWARERALHYEVIGITAWKVFAAGRSTPTREQKARWGAEAAKKLMCVQALWERFRVRFPNHSISDKTGKPIEFRFDCVDAVAQAMYAAYLRHHCARFIQEFPVPPDHVFAKPNRRRFVYE